MTCTTLAPEAEAPYDAKFFAEQADGSLRSARLVVPIVMEMFRPKSVIDVGCGLGTWLKAFAENGVEDYLGLDGEYVDPARLVIDSCRFRATDLSNPRPVGRTYDLAVCLEVGEHLPPSVAPALVRVLAAAAPLVLFSAAVPGQVGTHHVNEQWPSYWKSLFERFGHRRLDPIRPRVWRDTRVEIWYRQNIFLYASAAAIDASPALRAEEELARSTGLELISSRYIARVTTARGILAEAPRVVWRAVKRRLQW
jgi:SAM-dependent methyltransferase